MTPEEVRDAYKELGKARRALSTIDQTITRRRAEVLRAAMEGGESVAGSERIVEVDVKDLAVDRQAKVLALQLAEDRLDMFKLLVALDG